MTTNSTPVYPEIERAANSILAASRPSHPLLAAWVEVVATDPNEQRRLVEFIATRPSDIEQAVALGWPVGNLAERMIDYDAHPREKYRTPADYQLARREDQAVYLLATAVTRFRRDGRPSGDVTSDVSGVALLTTSLAAAVAEYVENIKSAWGIALSEARPL